MSYDFVPPKWVGGTAVGWVLADYVTVAKSSEPATAGVATIELPPLDDDERWLIDHAITSCTSSLPTDLRWYDGSVGALYMIEQTDNGNLDVSDWPQGLQRTSGAPLTLVWTGASAGARGTVNLQARVLRRRS